MKKRNSVENPWSCCIQLCIYVAIERSHMLRWVSGECVGL
jgi:hypothetical protein